MERFDMKASVFGTAVSIALAMTATTAYAGAGHVKKHQRAAHKVGHHSKAQTRTAKDPFHLPTEYWIKTGHVYHASRAGSLHLPPLVIANLPELKRPIPGPLQNSPNPQGTVRQARVTRRMAGVVFANNGVYAVLETGGDVQMVQPGDRVSGGRVISIESNCLTIRTDSHLMIRVPLASSNEVEQVYSDPAGYGSDSHGYRGDASSTDEASSGHAARPDIMFN